MHAFAIAAAALLELSLHEVIASVPHDAGAMIVFALLLGFVYFIWYGSRRSTIDRYTGTPPSGDGGRADGDGRKNNDVR